MLGLPVPLGGEEIATLPVTGVLLATWVYRMDDLLVVFAEKVPSALATVRAHARATS